MESPCLTALVRIPQVARPSRGNLAAGWPRRPIDRVTGKSPAALRPDEGQRPYLRRPRYRRPSRRKLRHQPPAYAKSKPPSRIFDHRYADGRYERRIDKASTTADQRPLRSERGSRLNVCQPDATWAPADKCRHHHCPHLVLLFFLNQDEPLTMLQASLDFAMPALQGPISAAPKSIASTTTRMAMGYYQ